MSIHQRLWLIAKLLLNTGSTYCAPSRNAQHSVLIGSKISWYLLRVAKTATNAWILKVESTIQREHAQMTTQMAQAQTRQQTNHATRVINHAASIMQHTDSNTRLASNAVVKHKPPANGMTTTNLNIRTAHSLTAAHQRQMTKTRNGSQIKLVHVDARRRDVYTSKSSAQHHHSASNVLNVTEMKAGYQYHMTKT